jgi:hypothetical protein
MALSFTAASSPPQQHPPPLPSDPSISQGLTEYLQQFSLWCRQGFAAKLNATSALPGVLLQAKDPPAGTAPAVFMIQVTTAGAIVATPVAVGAVGATRTP